MRRILEVRVLLGTVLGALMLGEAARACSCERAPDGGIRSPAAAQVFVGRVVTFERVLVDQDAVERTMERIQLHRSPLPDLRPYMRACFAIDRVEKGLPVSSVCLRTGFGGGDCGFAFQVGSRYRVSAHPVGDSSWELRLETGICDETEPLR